MKVKLRKEVYIPIPVKRFTCVGCIFFYLLIRDYVKHQILYIHLVSIIISCSSLSKIFWNIWLMKIEYDGICANVLKDCPLPCFCCAFNFRACSSGYQSSYISCDVDGFEKDQGYIFKVWEYSWKAKYTIYADRVKLVSFMAFIQLVSGVNFLLNKYIISIIKKCVL